MCNVAKRFLSVFLTASSDRCFCTSFDDTGAFAFISELWSKWKKQHWETIGEKAKDSGFGAKPGPVSTLLKLIKGQEMLVTIEDLRGEAADS